MTTECLDVPVYLIVFDIIFTIKDTCLYSLNILADILGVHWWTDFVTGVSHELMSHELQKDWCELLASVLVENTNEHLRGQCSKLRPFY